MPKRFLKYMPRCENPRNLRIFHFCIIKIDLWSKFSNFKHLQKINEGPERSKISIRAVFWHYECNKRFVFAKFKTCILEKWPKFGIFPTVHCWDHKNKLFGLTWSIRRNLTKNRRTQEQNGHCPKFSRNPHLSVVCENRNSVMEPHHVNNFFFLGYSRKPLSLLIFSHGPLKFMK